MNVGSTGYHRIATPPFASEERVEKNLSTLASTAKICADKVTSVNTKIIPSIQYPENSLLGLPDELIIKIYEKIEGNTPQSKSNRATFKLTCKRLLNLPFKEIYDQTVSTQQLEEKEKFFRIFSNLESITLKDVVEISHLQLLSKLKHLKNIKFCEENRLTDEKIYYLKDFPALKNLSLRNCKNLTPTGFKDVVSLINLEKLDLTGTDISGNCLVHVSQLIKLTNLSLNTYVEMKDVRFENLSSLTNLEELDLSGTDISDNQLAVVKNFPVLKKLILSDCKEITSVGFKHLIFLKSIEELDLSQTKISASDMVKWDFPKLTSLKLNNCYSINDAAMQHLSKQHMLKILYLAGCYEISVAGFDLLTLLKCLENLNLSWTKVNNKALASLSNVNTLKILDLSACQKFTDAGIKHLAKLVSLKELNMNLTKISDRGFALLNKLIALKNLNLSNCTNIRNINFGDWTEASKIEKLNLSSTEINDEGVASLSNLKQLKQLELPGCSSVADTGVKSLSSLEKLECLDVSDTLISKKNLTDLKGLKTLHIGGCTESVDGDIQYLTALEKLEFLYLDTSRHITPQELETFKKSSKFKCPRIFNKNELCDSIRILRRQAYWW